MSVLSWFEGVGQWIWNAGTNAVNVAYNDTIGEFESSVGNAVLSSAETFAEDIVSGFLSFLAIVFGWIQGQIVDFFGSLVLLAKAMGILGPVIMILTIFTVAVSVMLVIKAVITEL